MTSINELFEAIKLSIFNQAAVEEKAYEKELVSRISTYLPLFFNNSSFHSKLIPEEKKVINDYLNKVKDYSSKLTTVKNIESHINQLFLSFPYPKKKYIQEMKSILLEFFEDWTKSLPSPIPVITHQKAILSVIKQLRKWDYKQIFTEKIESSSSKPIWISKIEEKHQKNEYTTMNDLIADINLMVNNCLLYYKGSDFYTRVSFFYFTIVLIIFLTFFTLLIFSMLLNSKHIFQKS